MKREYPGQKDGAIEVLLYYCSFLEKMSVIPNILQKQVVTKTCLLFQRHFGATSWQRAIFAKATSESFELTTMYGRLLSL